jgi:hypothetical protein
LAHHLLAVVLSVVKCASIYCVIVVLQEEILIGAGLKHTLDPISISFDPETML